MQKVMKSVAVIIAGAGLAFVLAAAALWALLMGWGAPSEWSDVQGTRVVMAGSAVVLVHLLWIATWCVWRGLGWARFVAALFLLPVTGLLAWLVARVAWLVSTLGNGWSLGSDLLTQEPELGAYFVLVALVPAVVIAVSVLVTVFVPARDASESMLVRPAWEPRTLLRGAAMTGVALGAVVLTGYLVLLLLMMAGLV